MSNEKIQGNLNFFTGTILVLTVILGSGLLILPGIVYRMIGDAAIYTWILCSVFSIPLLLVMVELGRIYQSTGGVAYYARVAFGKYFEVLVCVFLLGAVSFGLPSIALTGGLYLSNIGSTPNTSVLYAIVIVVGAAFLASRESRSIPRIINFLGGSVLFALVAIIIVFIATILIRDSSPIEITPIGKLSGNVVLQPFMLVFFSYTGWEIASHLAEDFKKPRDFPVALGFSFLIVCFLYISSAWLVQQQKVSNFTSTAMNTIGEHLFGSIAAYPISILAFLLVFANIFGAISAIARLVHYMASNKYLPAVLGRLKHGTPINAILVISFVLILNILLSHFEIIDIDKMFTIAGQNFMVLYLIAALCLFKLSKSIYARSISLMVGIPSIFMLLKYSVTPFYTLFLLAITQIIFQFTKEIKQ